MKTSVECLPCFLDQALRVARMQGCDEMLQIEVVQQVAALLPGLDLGRTPPANAMQIYRVIAAATGCSDPYLEVKRDENARALRNLPLLQAEVEQAGEPLRSAIGFAIAGNVIDYGAAGCCDIDGAFDRCREKIFVIDDSRLLLERVGALSPGGKVLYLADNCGEIVYDSLVVELLAKRGLQVTVAVRSGPIINDALLEDALCAGLDKFAHIIGNGTDCPGTPLDCCSQEFRDSFDAADLVISKGQGNFETLSEVEREIFFLLTVKCKVVGRHLVDISGCSCELPGNGEMVVLYSGKKEY
jgi:hypothetical protein